ncbi:hypothetical protein PVK06_047035 [Gossypium arboreum]|uniref:Aminotransferase-like plant mobile domain-containing protein n=1 Tax=Gossypium arboreum TaxID=29729 RepID=A0ABR0MCE1_GOSAR|nr:hypothetical protein PVK06_047035 [Gossypium arboreum]
MIGQGCKLDPKLINALIERWRPETHTFHLPCEECTIILEDVHLQLGLPVDGDAVTGSVHSADWGAVCYELLGAIPDNINGGRIEMGWLRDTFPEPDDDSTELEKIRYARAYILQIIGEQLVNLVGGLPCWQHYTGRCAGIRDRIKRKSEFQWTPYEDPAIRAVIPDEYLQNPNAWHVKVSLVNFSIVEIHQLDRVLRQFGFRQPIPVAPEVLDDHHKIDLRPMAGWNVWPGSSPFPITPSGPLIYRQPSHEGSQEGPSGSSSFYQSPSPYGFQTPPPLMMQTPPQSLFYQGGSSSQHPQPESSSEQAQPRRKLDKGGIQRVTVDDLHVAMNLTGTDIDFYFNIFVQTF